MERYAKIGGGYSIDKWYRTPKDDNTTFKIISINPNENKIIINVQKQKVGNGVEKRSYNIDDFITFLHQPELFESKKFGRLK